MDWSDHRETSDWLGWMVSLSLSSLGLTIIRNLLLSITENLEEKLGLSDTILLVGDNKSSDV